MGSSYKQELCNNNDADSDEKRMCRFPPCQLRPPYPPINDNNNYNNTKLSSALDKTVNLPKINSNKQKSSQQQQQQQKVVKSKKLLHKKVRKKGKKPNEMMNTSTDTLYDEMNSNNFICRLCGMNCLNSALLYAHLLIIEHRTKMTIDKLNTKNMGDDDDIYEKDNLYFICRRCGKQWQTRKLCHQGDVNQHWCIQQKVAHLTTIVFPKDSILYGLPFICLFCCYSSKKSIRNVSRIRNCPQKSLSVTKSPLKLYETCQRFWSKLHLVLHILCRHSVRRKPGTCAECGIFNRPTFEDYTDESEFWKDSPSEQPIKKSYSNKESKAKNCLADQSSEMSTSSSESDDDNYCKNNNNNNRPRSSDSLLFREGLQNLEIHIDEYHLPQIELFSWLKLQYLNRQNTEYDWIYSCPMCQLMISSNDDTLNALNKENQLCHRITSNAMLQAHIVCYHAGVSQIDSLLGNCQICCLNHSNTNTTDNHISVVDFTSTCKKTSLSYNKHLIRAKHMKQLQNNYELAIQTGRIQQIDSLSMNELDFTTTTCILCWKRFLLKPYDSLQCLYAQCRLQVHLLTTHCTYIGKRGLKQPRGKDYTLNGYYNIQPCGWCGKTYESYHESGDQRQFNWREIYNWYKEHEEQHALNLTSWWWENQHCK
ncbi:unnamed protein product [Trichobilharzia szidati]|nr:unnamed protein product [Trichobilharzia szidati]